MHRQLKQTAFFVADTARTPCRHLGRHYHAPGRQRSLPDVEGRVVVGWRSNAAADALELIPAWPVALINQVAARALAARVPGVYQIDRDATHPAPCIRSRHEVRGSSQLCNRLRWRPLALTRSRMPSRSSMATARPAAFLASRTIAIAQHVVGVALEACLRPPQARLSARLAGSGCRPFCKARRRECWRRRTSSICAPL